MGVSLAYREPRVQVVDDLTIRPVQRGVPTAATAAGDDHERASTGDAGQRARARVVIDR